MYRSDNVVNGLLVKNICSRILSLHFNVIQVAGPSARKPLNAQTQSREKQSVEFVWK